MYKLDNKTHEISNYATYDEYGKLIKRVDVTGKPHGGVPTPHVVDAGRTLSPKDWKIRVQTKGLKVRPARSDEIPSEIKKEKP